MVREIEFRGKSVLSIKELDEMGAQHDNGWIYGNLITNGNEPWIVGDVADVDSEFIALEWWNKVVPETVGQFVGEYTCDKKKIFEGDILQPQNYEKSFYTVVYNRGRFERHYKFMREYQGEKWVETTELPMHSQSHRIAGDIHADFHLVEVPNEQS